MSYEKKKEYNSNWTSANTKNVTIRFNKNDEVWEQIELLKANGLKMNAIFKGAVEKEYEQIKKEQSN